MSEYDKVHSLLSETSTMARLAVTPAQQAALRAVHNIEWQSIPVVSNLLTRSTTAGGATRHSLLTDADRAASQYKLNRVAATLSPEQWRALQSILLRETGLSVVLYSEEVRAQLGIAKDQLERMRLDAARYEPLFDGLNQRIGRQKVAGLRPDEDIAQREQEVECIERVMQALTADRNSDIRSVLTKDQKDRWDILVGAESGGVPGSTPNGVLPK